MEIAGFVHQRLCAYLALRSLYQSKLLNLVWAQLYHGYTTGLLYHYHLMEETFIVQNSLNGAGVNEAICSPKSFTSPLVVLHWISTVYGENMAKVEGQKCRVEYVTINPSTMASSVTTVSGIPVVSASLKSLIWREGALQVISGLGLP